MRASRQPAEAWPEVNVADGRVLWRCVSNNTTGAFNDHPLALGPVLLRNYADDDAAACSTGYCFANFRGRSSTGASQKNAALPAFEQAIGQ